MSFLTAQQARDRSRNPVVIFNEIRSIEESILNRVELGEFSTSVQNTTMTDDTTGIDYFDVWKNLSTNRVLEDQMNQVIAYFTRLGYSINRRTNTVTNNTFIWDLIW